MVKHSTLLAAVTIVAGPVVFLAPIAGAQNPPPPCAPGDQQCVEQQQRDQAADIADQIIDNVQDGLNPANEPATPESGGGPGIMVLKDGVPWCMPLYQPIPPGVVLTSPTGSGQTTYC